MLHGVSGASRKLIVHPVLEMGLLFFSAALFSLSFPNDLNVWGFGPLAFVALLPLIILVNRTSWRRLFFYAPLAGFSTYILFNYWLAAYHPLAIFIIGIIYAFFYLLLLPLLRLARELFPRYGWAVQLIIWVAWEYLRTLGFLGYPYGILAYSQYCFAPLANLASWTGIWGVSLIVASPAFLLAWRQHGGKNSSELPSLRQNFVKRLSHYAKEYLIEFSRRRWQFGAWLGLLGVACLVGGLSMVDYSAAPRKRLALIQQNIDPWIGGTRAYAESLNRLIRQTDLALTKDTGIQMVVWSETSFVPAIEYHYRFRDDSARFALVSQLKDYMASKSVPFVLGNGEAEPVIDVNGHRTRRDYNAVLLYEGRELKQSYRKLRLVPFTEYFPYRESFPWLYQLLVDHDTSFWEPGSNLTVMHAAGFSFGTPICFEDSFAYMSKDFVNAGAQVIVNLSNDAWSKSVPAAMQHLAMASFRAIETRRSVVRSTNAGMSGLIDPNGRIVSLNAPFTESYLIVDVPVFTGNSPFSLWAGDWLGVACLTVGAGLLVGGIIRVGWRRCKLSRKKPD